MILCVFLELFLREKPLEQDVFDGFAALVLWADESTYLSGVDKLVQIIDDALLAKRVLAIIYL